MNMTNTVKVGDSLEIINHRSIKTGEPISDRSWIGELMTIKAIAMPFVLVEQTDKMAEYSYSSEDMILNVDTKTIKINGRANSPYGSGSMLWDYTNRAEALHTYDSFKVGDVICDRGGVGLFGLFKVVEKKNGRIRLFNMTRWDNFFDPNQKDKEFCFDYIEDKSMVNSGWGTLGIISEDYNAPRFYRLPFEFVKVVVDRMEAQPSHKDKVSNLYYRLFPEQFITTTRAVFYSPSLGQVIRVNIDLQPDFYKMAMNSFAEVWNIRKTEAEKNVNVTREELEKASKALVKAEQKYEEARKALEIAREEGKVLEGKHNCPICDFCDFGLRNRENRK